MTNRAIYLVRHPIDVMMSAWDFDHLIKGGVCDTQSPAFHVYIHHWLVTGGGTFPEFGPWTQHVRSWLGQSDIPMHLVTYENLVDNPERELKSHSGFSLHSMFRSKRQRVAIERSSMKSMAALESEEVEERVDGIFFRNSLASGYGQGHRFINKGYRKSYEILLNSEERAIADRTFGNEIDQYFGNRS